MKFAEKYYLSIKIIHREIEMKEPKSKTLLFKVSKWEAKWI